VGDAMTRLDERLLMTADSSMLDFLEQADTHPVRVLLDGARIWGIVTAKDASRSAAQMAVLLRLNTLKSKAVSWVLNHIECDKTGRADVNERTWSALGIDPDTSLTVSDVALKLKESEFQMVLGATKSLGALDNLDDAEEVIGRLGRLCRQISHPTNGRNDEIDANAMPGLLRQTSELLGLLTSKSES
ncbi:MAG: hypothetical protein KDA66_08475, partial [Planctomycetaceae bacterium]|nr:hypothetical protein [Planctomycetaceae bacterium]